MKRPREGHGEGGELEAVLFMADCGDVGLLRGVQIDLGQ